MSDAPRWFKSSYSNTAVNCVEVAVTDAVPWFTSSFSSVRGGNCLEVALTDPMIVLLRDTQNRGSTVLSVGCAEWSGWVRAVVRG